MKILADSTGQKKNQKKLPSRGIGLTVTYFLYSFCTKNK